MTFQYGRSTWKKIKNVCKLTSKKTCRPAWGCSQHSKYTTSVNMTTLYIMLPAAACGEVCKKCCDACTKCWTSISTGNHYLKKSLCLAYYCLGATLPFHSQFTPIHMRGYEDFFFQLNLLPRYLLRLQGDTFHVWSPVSSRARLTGAHVRLLCPKLGSP